MLRNPKKDPPKIPATWVEVPTDYTNSPRWTPRIGENFPNFSADSTIGKVTFHPYTTGNWTIFFSIADAFSETCTRELISLAALQDDLWRAGVKVLGIARNSVAELNDWCAQASARGGQRIRLPIMSDPDGLLTSTFGMILPHEEVETTIRKTIIINPQLKVSMLFEYPLYISRSTDEMLRALDAAQEHYDELAAQRIRF
ncbi:redoxin domain-containing protein [Pseudooceanicola sp. 502str34]|uniref:redoxin domain-containing protein n=1 Tax=Maritimibacter alkaliphilus TaxID=404236 RepID=UPI001C979E55|nr:redoxin domain-containing protein [Maritimibacter alkaliphilus]MBY6089539.1 redoxin domain-containing protein [Maritimibacter alkaliphilus]